MGGSKSSQQQFTTPPIVPMQLQPLLSLLGRSAMGPVGAAGEALTTAISTPPAGTGDLERATSEAFDRVVLPTLQNEFSLMGLGRSGPLTEAISTGKASVLPQILAAGEQSRQFDISTALQTLLGPLGAVAAPSIGPMSIGGGSSGQFGLK